MGGVKNEMGDPESGRARGAGDRMPAARGRRGLSLAVKYALFAALATLCNIGVQRGFLLLYSGDLSLYGAMLLGTAAGLGLKYVLDKRYIFHFRVENLRQDVRKFILYALMGIVTTGVFWATELLFDFLFQSGEAKYGGAALGLALGYTLKYFLDKRFVFRRRPAGAATGG